MFFLKNHADNETGKLVPDLILFFKKALCEVKKSKRSVAQFQYISIVLNLAYNKNKLCKTLDY